MHRLKFRVAVGVLTFAVGASAGVYLRRPGPFTERACVFARDDRPVSFTRHPFETFQWHSAATRVE